MPPNSQRNYVASFFGRMIISVTAAAMLAACGEESLLDTNPSVLRGSVTDAGGMPIAGAEISVYYGFERTQVPSQFAESGVIVSSSLQPDSLLEEFSVERASSTCVNVPAGSCNRLVWKLAPGVSGVAGFKVFSDNFLRGFPTKINQGVLPVTAESFEDVPDTQRPLFSVFYVLHVVLADGEEVAYVPVDVFQPGDDPPPTPIGNDPSRQTFLLRAFPSIASGNVTAMFSIPTADRINLRVIRSPSDTISVFSISFPPGFATIGISLDGIPSGVVQLRLSYPDGIAESVAFVNGGRDAVTNTAGVFSVPDFAFGAALPELDLAATFIGTARAVRIDSIRVLHPDYFAETRVVNMIPGQELDLRFTLTPSN